MKGPQERNRHKSRVKGVGKLGWFMSNTQTLTSPPREDEPAETTFMRNTVTPTISVTQKDKCEGVVVELNFFVH